MLATLPGEGKKEKKKKSFALTGCNTFRGGGGGARSMDSFALLEHVLEPWYLFTRALVPTAAALYRQQQQYSRTEIDGYIPGKVKQ